MEEGSGQGKEIFIAILALVLAIPLMTAGLSGDGAAFFLLLFIFLGGAFVLDMLLKFDKGRKKPRVHPTVSEIRRAVDEGERKMDKARDEYLKKVRTMTRR